MGSTRRYGDSDREFLFNFLDKLSDEERATLKENLNTIEGFASPNHAIPAPGYG